MSDTPPISSDEQLVIDKYAKYKSVDPFPDIPPALLNSADIHSYVNTIGMIYPFDKGQLKSASYAAKIAGECKYWDEEKKKFKTITLSRECDKLTLRPNAIAFVGIEPTFRLPDYIALRFNLKITHVYRGLLLGTGPLIDPGFEGNISIPLHNLTNNEYVFSFNETLIWIEFTKTSPIQGSGKIKNEEEEFQKHLRYLNQKKFPEDKKYKPLDYYLGKALKGSTYDGVVSSIPPAIAETKESAEAAKNSAKAAKVDAESAKNIAGRIATVTFWGGFIGSMVVVGTFFGIYLHYWGLQKDYLEQVVINVNNANLQAEKTYEKDINKVSGDIISLENQLSNNTHEIEKNIQNLVEQQNQIILSLKNRVEQLEGKTGKLIGRDSINEKQN